MRHNLVHTLIPAATAAILLPKGPNTLHDGAGAPQSLAIIAFRHYKICQAAGEHGRRHLWADTHLCIPTTPTAVPIDAEPLLSQAETRLPLAFNPVQHSQKGSHVPHASGMQSQ